MRRVAGCIWVRARTHLTAGNLSFLHTCRLRSVLAALGAAIATSTAAQLDASTADFQQQQQPAPLGRIPAPAILELCAQLLAALQAATLLTCSPALCRQLDLPLSAEAAGAGAVQAAECLEEARAAVAADEALQLELARSLNVGAAEAAALLQLYPPFAQLAQAHPFVAAELSAAGGAAAADAPPGLLRFLAAAAEAAR